jgi:hypothetical protein
VRRSMIVADTYRRYSAKCVYMCRMGEESINEKALLIEMATKWPRLAEFAERRTHKQSTPGLCKSRRRLLCSCSRSIFVSAISGRRH